MTNPYEQQQIIDYNTNPPPDDGSNVPENEITWAGIKTKLTDPVKTGVENVDQATFNAFETVKDFNTDVLTQGKGGMIAANGTIWTRVEPGTDGQILTADSSEATGVKWASELIRPSCVINGAMRHNQRVFAGGALAAGDYGRDRFKADVGGANMSVDAAGLITLTSGTIVQVIETPIWLGWDTFASKTVAVSVEDLSGGDLSIDVGGTPGTITAGSGLRYTTIDVGAAITGNLELKLKLAAGAVTFRNIKLEIGGYATPYRESISDLALVLRYYSKSYAAATAPGTDTNVGIITRTDRADSAVSTFGTQVNNTTLMSGTPTVTLYARDGTEGNVRYKAGLTFIETPGTLFAVTEAGFSVYVDNVSGLVINDAISVDYHYTQEAEL